MTDDRVISRHKLAQALYNSNDHVLNDAGFQVDFIARQSKPW